MYRINPYIIKVINIFYFNCERSYNLLFWITSSIIIPYILYGRYIEYVTFLPILIKVCKSILNYSRRKFSMTGTSTYQYSFF
nr:MAG TPA: hypothetical protein [Crassvirales sp.]